MRTADGRFDTSYLHLSAARVEKGDRVRLGEGSVRWVPAAGARPPAPHLHFGVRAAGSRHAYRNPLDFLAAAAHASAARATSRARARRGAGARRARAGAGPAPRRRVAPGARTGAERGGGCPCPPGGVSCDRPGAAGPRHASVRRPGPAPSRAGRRCASPCADVPRRPFPGPGRAAPSRPRGAPAGARRRRARTPSAGRDGGPDLGWALCVRRALARRGVPRPARVRAAGR